VQGMEQILTAKNTKAEYSNPLLFGDLSTRQTIESLSLYNLPGVASFFYRGKNLELPKDFRTVWKTRPTRP
jgi:hypothetical protein